MVISYVVSGGLPVLGLISVRARPVCPFPPVEARPHGNGALAHNSCHERKLPGMRTIVFWGMVTVMPLTVTVPPERTLVESVSVADWIKPVIVNGVSCGGCGYTAAIEALTVQS
jgi:hypothetical protein